MRRVRLLTLVALTVMTGAVVAARWRHSIPQDSSAEPAREVSTAPAGPATAEPSLAVVAPEDPATPGAVQGSAATVAVRKVASAPAPAEHPASGGMVVAIDPETGAFGMPSPEQMRELFPPGTSAASTPEGFVLIERPDGAVGVEVGSQLQEYSFVQIGRDGKPVHGCAPAPANLRSLTATPALTPKVEEE